MSGIKVIAKNKKAFHEYFVEERFEAGMVLKGTEIKSIRAGRINLKEGFARIHQGELYLMNVHISEYEQGNIHNHDPIRTRKLLMHKGEISKLIGLTKEKGYSIIPIKVFLKNGFAKIDIALAKGKKQYDKRETMKRKDANREMQRALKERQQI